MLLRFHDFLIYRRINMLDIKIEQFVSLHKEPIRDIAFNSVCILFTEVFISNNTYQFKFDTNVQSFDFTSFFLQVHQDQLLSVSQDKTIRLTNISSKSEIQRFHCESEVWACCWNTDNPFLFYVGKYLKNVCGIMKIIHCSFKNYLVN